MKGREGEERKEEGENSEWEGSKREKCTIMYLYLYIQYVMYM